MDPEPWDIAHSIFLLNKWQKSEMRQKKLKIIKSMSGGPEEALQDEINKTLSIYQLRKCTFNYYH